MKKEVALLLFHPVFMPEAPFDLFALHLEVLVQSIQSLLLQINLRFGPRIADLLVLLHLELVQVSVLRKG